MGETEINIEGKLSANQEWEFVPQPSREDLLDDVYAKQLAYGR